MRRLTEPKCSAPGQNKNGAPERQNEVERNRNTRGCKCIGHPWRPNMISGYLSGLPPNQNGDDIPQSEHKRPSDRNTALESLGCGAQEER